MATQTTLCTVLALTLYVFGFAAGREPYGHLCEKFAVGEEKPKIENGGRYCIRQGDYDYCRSYTCPKPECEQPLTSTVCPYCPGTCSYGGSTYKVGERFTCLDGSNGCACFEGNGFSTTFMAQHPEWMCLVPLSS